MDSFHLLRPAWLLLIPLCGTLLWLLWRHIYRRSNWEGQCDPLLLKALLVGAKSGNQWLPLLVLGSIWLAAVIALTGPTWERLPQPVYSHNQGRVLIFDVSLSMDSTDLAPSRLIRARYKLADLVAGAKARQQALVVFAGDAFVVSPFTDDNDTLSNLIPALDTRTVPIQGSRADLGLKLAAELIENSALTKVEIILITDGVPTTTHEIAQNLADKDHRISVLAVGTEQGAPIPLSNGGLLKDAGGNIVIPRIDRISLQQLASIGNGIFQVITSSDSDIRLFNGSDSLPELANPGPDLEQDMLSGDNWIDRGIWLLLPILVLASFGFRRGWILGILVIVLPITEPVHAFDWRDLWTRPDQQAAQALRNEQPDKVPATADSRWQGAAAFRQGNHAEAAEHYANLENSSAHYNRGNALARSGSLSEAIKAYDQAIVGDPNMEDALFNKELVEKLLSQQQQHSNQSQQSGDQSNEGENQDFTNSEKTGGDPQKGGQRPDQDNPMNSGRGPGDSSEQYDGGESRQTADQQNQQDPTEDLKAQQSQVMQGEEGESESMTSSSPMAEDQQALEHWLKQVPDDPGGLLRRKFSYQYSQRSSQPIQGQPW